MSKKFLNINIYVSDLPKLKIQLLLAVLDAETYADFENAYKSLVATLSLTCELRILKHTLEFLKLQNNPNASIFDDLKTLYAQRDYFHFTVKKSIK